MSEENGNNSNDNINIEQISIEKEMQKSYIDYAMSVIVSRALPDVRDGLKPVHRRILYAMSELGLEPNKPYRKSARIVGDTMGKYHPHGDSSIYEAMVRMAQDFSTRYMLVDGHGNYGSMDGDSAAAMRYTEARLSKISTLLLDDIDKETVDFYPNFDETLQQPAVLPARYPNLLVNGTMGIAVGMATNIPPHNMTEVLDASLYVIEKYISKEIVEMDDLLSVLKGPDFPTGATILGINGIREAYKTGRGKVKIRSKATIEPLDKDREQIVVTEIPYQVNKSKLVEKIAELVRDKKIEGITDLRDETDRNGVKIVIELKKDANSSVILNQLYKNTQLQDTFSVNMIALVDGQPRTLNIIELLNYYIEHQKDIILRRTRFQLRKAQERAHILEGLKKAIDMIDEVLSVMRSSKNNSEAKERLILLLDVDDIQAQAITDLRFRSLTGLEMQKILDDLEEIRQLISRLNEILNSEETLLNLIKSDIEEIKQKFGDERRTEIVHDPGEIIDEDLIDEETCVVTLTNLNYIKRLPLDTYKVQNRGGKGIVGVKTREEDFVKNVFLSSTHDYLQFFTNFGKTYRVKTYELPESGRQAKGTPIVNILNLEEDEKITAAMPIRTYDESKDLIMITRGGQIKKTNLSEYKNIRKSGLRAINLKEGDKLKSVLIANHDDDVIIATKFGQGIRISSETIRQMSRVAQGVRALKLKKGDNVIGAEVCEDDKAIIIVTQKGYGKRLDADLLRTQNRNGKGVKIHKITDKTGYLTNIEGIKEDENLLLITSEGTVIRIRASQVSTLNRNTQGVKLMNLPDDIYIKSIAKVMNEDDEADEEFISDEVE